MKGGKSGKSGLRERGDIKVTPLNVEKRHGEKKDKEHRQEGKRLSGILSVGEKKVQGTIA